MSLITRLHYCLRYLSHCYSVIRYVPIRLELNYILRNHISKITFQLLKLPYLPTQKARVQVFTQGLLQKAYLRYLPKACIRVIILLMVCVRKACESLSVFSKDLCKTRYTMYKRLWYPSLKPFFYAIKFIDIGVFCD